MKTRLRVEIVVDHEPMVGDEELHAAVEKTIAGETVALTHDEAVIDEVREIETLEVLA